MKGDRSEGSEWKGGALVWMSPHAVLYDSLRLAAYHWSSNFGWPLLEQQVYETKG